jgi:catechol 2,3-dioxygenase-like lactoylglutathione lyase family enzyme
MLREFVRTVRELVGTVREFVGILREFVDPVGEFVSTVREVVRALRESVTAFREAVGAIREPVSSCFVLKAAIGEMFSGRYFFHRIRCAAAAGAIVKVGRPTEQTKWENPNFSVRIFPFGPLENFAYMRSVAARRRAAKLVTSREKPLRCQSTIRSPVPSPRIAQSSYIRTIIISMALSASQKIVVAGTCFGLAVVGFMVRLPSAFRGMDRELHTAFYFGAAAFLNLLFTKRNLGRHLLVVLFLFLFGAAIEYAQEYSNTLLRRRIHGRFDPQDLRANVVGLVGFSLVWLIVVGMGRLFRRGGETGAIASHPIPMNGRPNQRIAHLALVVDDYDQAIDFYTTKLGFIVVEDRKLGEEKRWVLVAPPGPTGCALLLAKAANERQLARVGDQTGGRVFLFLHTDNFQRDYNRFVVNGVVFVRPPEKMEYGTVAVFEDLYGNRWDLIG